MNIFVVDKNPCVAAQNLCDKHIVKMICETTQLLSNAHHVLDGVDICGLKPTHINHPCSKWVRECFGNYMWLNMHLYELLEQYKLRYGKIHAYDKHFDVLVPPRNIPPEAKSMFAYCGTEQKNVLTTDEDVVMAYRNYYKKEKRHFAKWKLGNVPEWFNEKE